MQVTIAKTLLHRRTNEPKFSSYATSVLVHSFFCLANWFFLSARCLFSSLTFGARQQKRILLQKAAKMCFVLSKQETFHLNSLFPKP